MSLLFFLLASLTLIFLLLANARKIRKKANLSFHPPPGPKGLPIIGNIHQLNYAAPHVHFAKLAKIYGPILSLQLGLRPAIVIQSANVAKEALKTQDHNLCGRPRMRGTQRLSYNELDIAFTPYGDYFREIKKLCMIHLFSSKRVQSFAPIRQEEVARLVKKIESLSSAAQVINLSELLMSFACSHICMIAFGKRYEENEVASKRGQFHTLMNDAEAMLIGPFFSDYLPFGGWLDKLTGASSKLERVFKDMDSFYDKIINEHLDPDKHQPDSYKEDIVDVLLRLREDGDSASFKITLDHIKAVLMNILLAGTDTSSGTLVWAMMELVKNPRVMRKAQDELRSSVQNKSCVDEEDLSKLEYLKAVIKETFRMHPASPLLVFHESINKTTLQGYDILPKTIVYVNAWAIGRDPESWNDPETFMPERFLMNSVDFKGQDFELIPFGSGRRICPGLHLAVTIIELALANLLYSFDWELPAGMKKEEIDTDVLPGVAMHKKNPLCLVAKNIA